MDYKIVMSDRNFNVLEEIQDIASNISWDYNRIGGCGSFSFEVPVRFCEETFLGGSFNVKIYRKNPATKDFDLWYQGRIEDKGHNVRGVNETISVRGSGYQSQLKDIVVNQDYASSEISAIVEDVLDTDIVPNTNITYDSADIEATSFTPDSIELKDKDALDVMQTLADVVGSREWGVDKDRKFFFKARSTDVGFRFPLDDKILSFSNNTSSVDIINRVIVNGGDVSGSAYREVIDYPASQHKWGRRDKVLSNSAIVTTQVANQFADAAYEEHKDIVRRARLEMLDEQLIEATIPIPLAQVVAKSITWGSRKYGTFLYSGRVSYQISSVGYKIDNNGALTIGLQLGKIRPNVAEDLSQLQYRLEQLRQTTA
jgi:hypothetical protein